MADKSDEMATGVQVFWSGDTRIVYDPDTNPEYPYTVEQEALVDLFVPKPRVTYTIDWDQPSTKP